MKTLRRGLHWLAYPVHTITDWLHNHVPHNKKVARIAIGSLVMMTGSTIAMIVHHYLDGGAAVVGDTVAYGLHGAGAAPIIKIVADALKIEI